eukprot:gnl/TRDRNA2_/TRDRNA2_34703_c0_seq1.p1 gnl/TRDRNA2_/TRDRNA2_34703_c0~~gnl/TRDRNA2_/TRDRNA2_34703_c0_seq1.p1  ORF type:complete len:403 (-),score=73.69 gnl/TRDRNA2_/TRDRNA2_34703_c0_seq1:50-1111(-)
MPLGEGQVLVRVEKFVLTANTITYALAGRMPPLSTFLNFPVPEDIPNAERYARCPCWGTGTIVTSRCPEVGVGLRIHGYFAMSPFVILTPTNIKATTFMDGAAHRKTLLAPYKLYQTSEDPRFKGLSADEEDFANAAGGQSGTGWAMSQLAATHAAKPEAMIITSASSRTSYGAAFAAKFHKDALSVVGLTSAKNVAYTQGLGVYDKVVAYEDVATLKRCRAAIFDVAGNSAVLQKLYDLLREDVVYCGMVGMTHVAARKQEPLQRFNGAAPEPFMVWTAVAAVEKSFGKATATRMQTEASKAYREKSLRSMSIVRHHGPEATLTAYTQSVNGLLQPSETHVCSLWPLQQSRL